MTILLLLLHQYESASFKITKIFNIYILLFSIKFEYIIKLSWNLSSMMNLIA